MKSNLPAGLDAEFNTLMAHGVDQNMPLYMRLRALRNQYPARGTDLDGQKRMKQAQVIVDDLKKDLTLPECVKREISKWLEEYACMDNF
jgi:uncharacterized protein (UPF0147 family)